MNKHTKAYFLARLRGSSKAKARAAVVESFQPFAKTKHRQIGRAIRKAERQLRPVPASYRTYEEQKALRDRWWAARGRGEAALPVTDPQMGSHHDRGRAIDTEAW